MFKINKIKRLNRRSFLANIIVFPLIFIGVAVVLSIPTGALDDASSQPLEILGIIVMIAGVATSWAFIIYASILRLHDANKSGWLSILLLVPFLSTVLALVLLIDKDKSSNKWGKVSKNLNLLVEIQRV